MNLSIFAYKLMEEKFDCVETPEKFYNYTGYIPKIGVINISCRCIILGKENKLHIFMSFENPEKAIAAGFECNPYSGKYNFLGITTQQRIREVFNHVFITL